MSGLRKVLEQTRERRQKAGSLSEETISALRRHRKKVHASYLFLLVILVAVVVFAGFGIVRLLGHPDKIALLAGGMGITVGGAVQLMRRLWSDWSQTGLLLVLIEDAPDSQLTAIVDKLIKKL